MRIIYSEDIIVVKLVRPLLKVADINQKRNLCRLSEGFVLISSKMHHCYIHNVIMNFQHDEVSE